MTVDVAMLESLSSFTEPAFGISERFVDVELRSGSTVGVLARPSGDPAPIGWLICHSFGPEQANLYAVEVAVARRLARRGFPVLRFHCQGYGDSARTDFTPSVESHVQDTMDAVEVLRALTGARTVGLVGARFGAAVAAMVAPGTGADLLVLLAPVVRGKRYLRQLIRARAIIELAEDGTPDAGPEDPWAALQAGGSVSVRGSMITADDYRAFDRIDLREIDDVAGAALVVQVSTSEEPSRDVTELVDHLRSAGVAVSTRIATDRFASLFGERHFRPADDDVLADMAADLNENIAGMVADWCAGLVQTQQEGGSAR
jgi:pimeloyl-ACP methyl ester carboxylesterase